MFIRYHIYNKYQAGSLILSIVLLVGFLWLSTGNHLAPGYPTCDGKGFVTQKSFDDGTYSDLPCFQTTLTTQKVQGRYSNSDDIEPFLAIGSVFFIFLTGIIGLVSGVNQFKNILIGKPNGPSKPEVAHDHKFHAVTQPLESDISYIYGNFGYPRNGKLTAGETELTLSNSSKIIFSVAYKDIVSVTHLPGLNLKINTGKNGLFTLTDIDWNTKRNWITWYAGTGLLIAAAIAIRLLVSHWRIAYTTLVLIFLMLGISGVYALLNRQPGTMHGKTKQESPSTLHNAQSVSIEKWANFFKQVVPDQFSTYEIDANIGTKS